ncbi:MAG: selenocysteine-specific translation elongation factor [Nannocystaceae bacterium]
MSRGPQALVVGTAGHIDHGKTTLVRALTGVDTDRLPEEKRRGITIELGFAPWRISPELEASIVDVPGHEGFVRTMVAGAGGIDLVLLVVSAEDGVMPQTREHINVCRLLGVGAGVVALTKIDRLGDDADAIELAIDDVRGALAGTPFADAPVVPCSAVTGAGIETLRETVRAIAAKLPRRDGHGPPILPVDRVFTIKGHGTVVTGTLLSGSIDVRNDEELVVVTHGPGREPFGVRARAAQVRAEGRDRVQAGNRLALNLAGIERDAVERGDVLTRGHEVSRQSFVHARVQHLPGHSPAWRAGTTLQVCAGTAHGIGVIDPLWLVPEPQARDDGEQAEVAPGRTAIVRVRLRGAAAGVARSTPGAARVRGAQRRLQRPHRRRWHRHRPRARQRPRHAQALDRVVADLAEGDTATRIHALLEDAGPRGLSLDELGRRAACTSPRSSSRGAPRASKPTWSSYPVAASCTNAGSVRWSSSRPPRSIASTPTTRCSQACRAPRSRARWAVATPPTSRPRRCSGPSRAAACAWSTPRAPSRARARACTAAASCPGT